MAAWRAAVVAAGIWAGCPASADTGARPKHEAPIPAATLALMAARNTAPASPILIRTYKKEAELEVWKQTRGGRFVLLKTFPVCRWSGQLGPKTKQGDRQTPEGFYAVGPKQMNPNSAYHLSFDVGFPNAYDRAHGASGAYLMVHGTCSSAGCYAMTDQGVAEIYALAREAFAGGQQAFQFQAYPFRMTAQNMAKYRSDPNIGFWRQLKDGSDRFEATGEEPAVTVSAGRYVFGPFKDPAKQALAEARVAQEEARVAGLVAAGSAAIRTTYADGGQHPWFRALAGKGEPLGQVSRPEALAFAGREIVVTPARKTRQPCGAAEACATQVADATAAAPEAVRPSLLVPLTAEAAPGIRPSPVRLFARTPLGYGSTRPTPVQSTIAGSMRIVPGVLTQLTF